MNVEKICRCCLTNDGPMITIYDGGATNKDCLCLAGMIHKITGIKPDPSDKLPDKACLLCIRVINDFYAFKIKCENSHRTLQQLFLSEVKVQINCPIKTSETKVASEIIDVVNLGQYEMAAAEVLPITQVKVESNIETAIPTSYVYNSMNTLAEEAISKPILPVSFQISSAPVETITHLENYRQIPSSTTEITKNPYKEFVDIKTNSCDSIEFIAEKPKLAVPIIPDTINNTEINDTAVEYIIKNLSSPQMVSEKVMIINETLNFVSGMQDLSHYPNHIENSDGLHYQCEQELQQENDFISNHLETQNHLTEHSNHTIHSHKPSIKLKVDYKPQKLQNEKKTKRKKKFQCEVCPYRFHSATTLSNHRRIHTGEKPFKCQYCDKSFAQATTWRNHENTHTSTRPYKCKFCEKTFTQSGTRNAHETTHYLEKPYKCQYCHKGFIRQLERVRHEVTHTWHEETHAVPSIPSNDETPQEPVKCQYCDRTFVKRGRCFRAHERAHKDRPYRCQYCQRGFISKGARTIHIKTHKVSDLKYS